MLNAITNLFVGPEQRRLNQFNQTQNTISDILSGTDLVRLDFSESQKREGEHRTELNALTTANPDLQIADKNVENESAAKRLKRRKCFTVIIEAILAISAVKLFFSETVNVNLSTGTAGSSGFAPLFWPIILGLVLAYVVLNEAISYKIDDAKKETTGFAGYWNRFSWLFPLLLIPFLNFYNILSHPGNPTNIIWVFFAVLSIWLNIKCVGYSKEFALVQNTAIAERRTVPHQEGLKKEEKIQERINRNMLKIKSRLMKPAADLKRLYLSFGDNKPELTLHPLYCILLNNRFYLYQLLPIHDIEIMNPPKNMNDYLTFWDVRTNVPTQVNPIAEKLPEAEEQVQPQITNAQQPETVKPPEASGQTTESNPTEQGAAAPDFSAVLSNEDEIIV